VAFRRGYTNPARFPVDVTDESIMRRMLCSPRPLYIHMAEPVTFDNAFPLDRLFVFFVDKNGNLIDRSLSERRMYATKIAAGWCGGDTE